MTRLSVDYSDDWQHVEGVENVAYRTPGGVTVGRQVKAIRSRLSKRALSFAANAGLMPTDITFTIWQAGLGGEEVETNGMITDGDGVEYAVLFVEYVETQYVATCRKVV